MISSDQIDLMRSTVRMSPLFLRNCHFDSLILTLISTRTTQHSPPHSADNDESIAAGMRFGLGFRLSAAQVGLYFTPFDSFTLYFTLL